MRTNALQTKSSAIVLSILVAACGGGGGSSPEPAPTPAPTPADTTGPSMQAVSPNNGATGVEHTGSIVLTANEALSTASMKVICGGAAVAGTTSVSGSTATFKPTDAYTPGASCTASVDAAATKDAAGNTFTGSATLAVFQAAPLACATPATASTAHPVGTVALCANIFVDVATPKSVYAKVVADYALGEAVIRTNFGSQVGTGADLIACTSDACAVEYAGTARRNVTLLPGTKAGTYTPTKSTVVLINAAHPANKDIAKHEMVHTEVYARLMGSMWRIPAWFNEGLASYWGGEPDCSSNPAKAVADLRTLDDQLVWNTLTNDTTKFLPTYCQARSEVAAWINKNGGSAKIVDLLNQLNAGTTFYTAYGALLTQ